jgi:hypothetical protein
MKRPKDVLGLVTPWIIYADQLEAKLAAVEHRLAEYMATEDPVAVSYAVQLRRIINDATNKDVV